MHAWLHRLRWLAALAVAANLATPVDAQRPVKRVLTIHGGTESFPGNVRFEAALREALLSDSSIEVDYYAEFLETEEFGATAGHLVCATTSWRSSAIGGSTP
jgi:hypothetical protein